MGAIPTVRDQLRREAQLRGATEIGRQMAWDHLHVIAALEDVAARALRAKQYAVARRVYRDIGEHIGMWPREAPQVNIDARSVTLGSDIIEAVGGIDGLRRLAAGLGEDDSADRD